MFSSLRKSLRWAAVGAAAALLTTALAGDVPALKIGDEAPAFSLAGTDGREHSLEAQRGRRNVILVFFRGVW